MYRIEELKKWRAGLVSALIMYERQGFSRKHIEGQTELISDVSRQIKELEAEEND